MRRTSPCIIKYSDLTRIVFNELTSGMDEGVLEEIERVRERYVDFMADQIRVGQAQGHLRSVDLKLAAVGLVGLVENLCAYHLKNPGKTSRTADGRDPVHLSGHGDLQGEVNRRRLWRWMITRTP